MPLGPELAEKKDVVGVAIVSGVPPPVGQELLETGDTLTSVTSGSMPCGSIGLPPSLGAVHVAQALGRPGSSAAEYFDDEERYLRPRPRSAALRMPWEVPGMIGFALGADNALPWLAGIPLPFFVPEPPQAPAVQAPVTPVASASEIQLQRSDLPAWISIAGHRRSFKLGASPEHQLSVAHLQWRSLVASMGPACRLYRDMAAALDEGAATASFDCAFFGKPSATLVKRAGSLNLYLKWAGSQNMEPWPVSEPLAFRYPHHLSVEMAPPSRATSWREALGFAKGFVGLEGDEDALAAGEFQVQHFRISAGRRCSGSATLFRVGMC